MSAEPLEFEFGASEECEYRPEGHRDDVEDESEHSRITSKTPQTRLMGVSV